ncbi:DUF4395 family protein [Aquibacillus halophilus]|uniref:DUF4395 family protein n=1 Tax=Aquibacillus halophilus TaxID=930132 RepID=A0A6A8DDX8_9BACI|nr:DUF4395 domain-containing protein [Aquibacillus halophilus]MRH43898.1 DUF4395 family protein [Aquibacillus halophilus]
MSIPKPLVKLNQFFIVISVILGLIFHEAILAIPFIIGIYTLITRKNPIILLGKRFLSKPLNQYIQEDKNQQIFNQWIATVCLGLSVLFFYLNFIIAAYVFSIMVAVAAGLALMGYCIGCTIRYRFMMWRYNRSKLQS